MIVSLAFSVAYFLASNPLWWNRARVKEIVTRSFLCNEEPAYPVLQTHISMVLQQHFDNIPVTTVGSHHQRRHAILQRNKRGGLIRQSRACQVQQCWYIYLMTNTPHGMTRSDYSVCVAIMNTLLVSWNKSTDNVSLDKGYGNHCVFVVCRC